ncbi:MAG: RloB family protein, partial [Candidatus Dormibacteraceae bacterium]
MKRVRPDRRRDYRRRKVDIRDPSPRILIVCEGTKTEPNYFRGFRVLSAEIIGEGYNTVSLVERARELRDADGPYDQVWCVFDHDSYSPGDFNAAVGNAESAGIRVAYSNEAFELWYCLHFAYITSGLG